VGKTGAGISTSAGIPDFRSPDTGLYANLARLKLPFAEAVFDISYFRNNPLPFYTLAHELYPGRYKPTIAHSFIKLLHDKGRLLKLFTQNIDCLEREAGVPADMIVEAHGSFATQRCIDCGTEFPHDLMKNIVVAKEVPRCLSKTCNGLVKPDIVFFGEALPEAFHRNRSLPTHADLAIVMGTSLTVQPFASLPSFVREETPRILINLERVGGLGGRADDVLLLGDCDAGVRKLADALGWQDELESLWKKTVSSKAAREDQSVPPKTRDEKLEDEVEKLTRDIEKSLMVSEEHTAWLKDHLSKKHNLQKGSEDDKAAPTMSLPSESEGAGGDAVEAVTNGDAKSSSAPAEAQDEGKGGITHVYPHLDPKVPVPLEKPSL
jgi:NAD+-dependent protein deacetylase SIR2